MNIELLLLIESDWNRIMTFASNKGAEFSGIHA
jgi:hypothetical protein